MTVLGPRSFPICLLAIGLLSLIGCSPEQQLGGVEIPNALPNTFITGEHPAMMEAGFVMHFFWDGHDPDGALKGFQWRLSDNGTDGISVQDTLTADPATGASLNPWYFTTCADTILFVSADIPGYPEDSELDPLNQRSFQSHTMFVRAVDEHGGVDPTPAILSFTSTTILPRIRVDRPISLSDYLDAQAMPPTVTLGYTGSDMDRENGGPAEIRHIFKPAWLDDHYVRTQHEFNLRVDDLISFNDPGWSDWEPYPENAADRLVTFSQLPSHEPGGELIIYLFAIQARDIAGAESIERTYSRNVHNIFISKTMSPVLEMYETHLGNQASSGLNGHCAYDITPGQELNFRWIATSEHYSGEVEAYRYGWDVADPDDVLDPHWAIEQGNTWQHVRTPATSFGSGTHTLTIQAWDNSNLMTRYIWNLEVVPVPDPAAQAPVLLVDDVKDQASQGWRAIDMVTPLDRDRYRDFFWDATLDRVMGWDNVGDHIDTESEDLTFRDIVNYRLVIWSSRHAQLNFIWDNFRPSSSYDPYNWLYNYQERVGNLFLVGERVLNEFVEDSRWMLPWVFDTDEVYLNTGSGWWSTYYRVGFGFRLLLDGSYQHVGKERYPYKGLGLATLDHTTPKYYVYQTSGSPSVANGARASVCAGVKALLLDPDFKAHHMPAGGIFPDTIYTDVNIDWMDQDFDYYNQLEPWFWGNDEMYDTNTTERPTYWRPQLCDDEPCVEPMFRQYSRFDWVDDVMAAAGDEGWPYNYLTNSQVTATCGSYCLNLETRRTVTTGAITGFISHKLEEHKPSRKGDVVWGFDPYRFDNQQTRQAIQWLLSEHFGLLLGP
ncbi:MAG: hypothetical protein ABIF77_00705 [bacterium]